MVKTVLYSYSLTSEGYEPQAVKKQFLWGMGGKKDRIGETCSVEFNLKKIFFKEMHSISCPQW